MLAAGEGSRLREVAPSKPLCKIAGRALLDHALDGLKAAGIARIALVLGYRADEIEAHLGSRSYGLHIETIRLHDYRLPNGVSVLSAAQTLANEDALLVMADHLVDPALYARVAEAGAGEGLTLAIDRRLGHDWVDPEDVTRVATHDGRISAIGKGLTTYDAYDTGVFAVSTALTDALSGLVDPSLSDGVRLLAAQGRAAVIDCSDLDWIDVDDAQALAKAEGWRNRVGIPAL